MISLRDVVTGFGVRDPLAEVWRRSLRGGGGGAAEITGVPPLRYIGDGRPLTNYRIAGNTIQDGTPSADAPVDAAGCGVRTGNLMPYPYYDQSGTINGILWTVSNSGHLKGNGVNNQGTNFFLSRNLGLKPGTYTLKIHGKHIGMTLRIYDSTGQGHVAAIPPSGVDAYTTFTIDSSISNTCAVYFNVGTIGQTVDIDCEVMLNLGSTPLPYEPYGYYLPLTVNGTEHPIYLGQVETTRRVKKVVLTGEETVRKDTNSGRSARYFIAISGIERNTTNLLSSHFTYSPWYEPGTMKGYLSTVYFSMESSQCPEIDDFKSYLAAQYAAGTPVTVWYVLAEPETAIVNEPLMKIGDYTDTVSFAQAGVTIPTVSGENILDVPTEVPPSEITIKGGISSV